MKKRLPDCGSRLNMIYMNRPAIAAEMNDTSVAPNSNLSPKRATKSPFSSFNDLMAPEMIPIELKFANDTKKTEVIPIARSDKPCILPKSNIATNSFDNNFVAINEPALTASSQGIPVRNANGAKTNPINVWKSHLIEPPDTAVKIPLTRPLSKAIIAI